MIRDIWSNEEVGGEEVGGKEESKVLQGFITLDWEEESVNLFQTSKMCQPTSVAFLPASWNLN